MADHNPFEKKGPPQVVRCEEWEAWLAETLDGELDGARSGAERAALEAHGGSCPSCSELLTRSKQGREWLQFLQDEPPVPPGLLGKILESTSGSATLALPVAAVPGIAGAPVWQVSVRRGFQETRLLMTVAMAFFSIALTLNLIGAHPGNMRLQDLSISSVQGSLVRSFYGTKQQVVHYYDNLRFVYQMESRLRELRRDAEQQTAPKKNKTGGQLNLPSPESRSPQWAGSEWQHEMIKSQRAEFEVRPSQGLILIDDQAERSLV